MKKIITTILFVIPSLLMALPTKTITFAWNPSPDVTVTGYKFYFATSSGAYTSTNSIDVGNALTFTWTIPGPGTYYNVVSAYNAQSLESPFSNEITENIPRPPLLLSMTGHAMNIQSYPGANIAVMSSSDLKNWSTLQTLTSATGSDTIAINQAVPAMFYDAKYLLASNNNAVVAQEVARVQSSAIKAPTLIQTHATARKYLTPRVRKGGEALIAHENYKSKPKIQTPPMPPMP